MRGQAHTLEATIAGLLLLTSLIFTMQMTAVTPLSASTSSQHIENQQQATGSGVLAAADRSGELKPALLYWNNSSQRFHDANPSHGYYTNGPPDNGLGEMLERSFNQRGIAYNVYIRYQNGTDANEIRYVYSGVPSDNAVTSTHTVTLLDDDHLYDADGTRNETTLGDANVTYPVVDQGTNVYSTVRVEVVAWRI